MPSEYDLVVLGTGVAATTAAFRCRAAGWRVAIVDHLPFGGTCALRGCDPKKVLVGVAEALDQTRRLRGEGIGGGEPSIDWRRLIAFKQSFTDPVPRRREEEFAKNGIDAFRGHARFLGPRSIEVGDESLDARFILIATGAVPMHLGIAGEDHLASSTDFLELKELPKRLVFVGGGFIAQEFSHVAARAGASVVVLEQSDRILGQFDQDLVSWLQAKSASLGIDIRVNVRVQSVEKSGVGFKVTVASHGDTTSLDADLVVHAAGRIPDVDSLDLAAGNVAQEKGRLALNEFLQSTSNSAVYAAGDAASSGPPLTPVASRDGAVVAANMTKGNHRHPDYAAVASVVFTIPPLAQVGLLEDEARRRNLRYRVRHEKTSDWYTARRVNEDCSGFKLLIEEETERILGAHLIGPHAEEVINIFALAIRAGLPASRLKETIFAYPTAGSDIGYML
ncbi:MAG: NAD(P)/FAD-dependent oxidoreductase [Bradyrhizobium sp.]|uniref:dihydrolipoyl dehydrogenase family protein n=1 Tax=Bradyrhizobium sp. TaxID=376 RepID=UPI001C290F05|nr:NAD(P)/FAD-dependent oxidoreductase [Bradyrhizobium sp.]MBU6464578.1 NAD(P)/FAD-dependent oxidoreductase [Pseudomonadota bacterium]MDE2069233.1 NAD(P)/FAD-dependent oxidoreductase [Bradyrhizobium sp.]